MNFFLCVSTYLLRLLWSKNYCNKNFSLPIVSDLAYITALIIYQPYQTFSIRRMSLSLNLIYDFFRGKELLGKAKKFSAAVTIVISFRILVLMLTLVIALLNTQGRRYEGVRGLTSIKKKRCGLLPRSKLDPTIFKKSILSRALIQVLLHYTLILKG